MKKSNTQSLRSRFLLALASAALLCAAGGIYTAPTMARQTPAPAAAKPILVQRGVSTDDKGDLGFDERSGHTPDIEDLAPDVRTAQTRAFVRGVRGTPSTASEWGGRALRAARDKQYEVAADAFAHAAAIYDAKGDPNAALVMRAQSRRYTTELNLYFSRKPTAASVHGYDTGRRLEPVYGTYLGAFIDHDDSVQKTFMDGDRKFRDAGEFDEKIGRRHATFFTYNGYGGKVPTGWFANLRENNAAAQWCIEPNRLSDIHDDATLRGMATAARDAGIPIFLRFASEMNGAWTPYHAPAALYKEKFRLVAKVFHEVAPNVAIVWCPNNLPETTIADYYPGEDATDWVGVNFYSTYFNDNDPRRPVAWRNPADNLDFIYKHYAARHPILVGEWAATHLSKCDGVGRADFAVDKIGQLYAAIPRKYPRVKAVHWFDLDAMRYAESESRKTNDYTLLSDPKVAAQYKAMTAGGYYLDTVPAPGARAMATEEIVPLAEKTPVAGTVTLSAWVKTYEERPTVTYTVAGKELKSFTVPGAYAFPLDTTALPNGPVAVTVTVRDSRGRTAATRTVTLLVRNGAVTQAVAKAKPKPSAWKTVPEPALAPKSVTLADLMGAAQTDAARLSLTRTPGGETVSLADRLRFRVTAGASGYLFVVLRRDSGDAAGEEILLSPRAADLSAGVNAARVEAGAAVSIPRAANRSLSPDAPGKYHVLAYLFADAAGAKQFAKGFGDGSQTGAVLSAARRGATVPAGTAPPLVAASDLNVMGGGR